MHREKDADDDDDYFLVRVPFFDSRPHLTTQAAADGAVSPHMISRKKSNTSVGLWVPDLVQLRGEATAAGGGGGVEEPPHNSLLGCEVIFDIPSSTASSSSDAANTATPAATRTRRRRRNRLPPRVRIGDVWFDGYWTLGGDDKGDRDCRKRPRGQRRGHETRDELSRIESQPQSHSSQPPRDGRLGDDSVGADDPTEYEGGPEDIAAVTSPNELHRRRSTCDIVVVTLTTAAAAYEEVGATPPPPAANSHASREARGAVAPTLIPRLPALDPPSGRGGSQPVALGGAGDSRDLPVVAAQGRASLPVKASRIVAPQRVLTLRRRRLVGDDAESLVDAAQQEGTMGARE